VLLKHSFSFRYDHQQPGNLYSGPESSWASGPGRKFIHPSQFPVPVPVETLPRLTSVLT
jgi:hypothetical protein